MAKKRQEEPKKGAPAWQSTFSDLMNLLLCFFVLLFSMSTVDAEKFEMVIASLQSSMSILPAGGSSIGEGNMVSAGVNQLEFLDSYYNDLANSKNPNQEFSHTTTKEDFSSHGLGLSIIEEICQRYDGVYEWKDQGEEFLSTVLLRLDYSSTRQNAATKY